MYPKPRAERVCVYTLEHPLGKPAEQNVLIVTFVNSENECEQRVDLTMQDMGHYITVNTIIDYLEPDLPDKKRRLY